MQRCSHSLSNTLSEIVSTTRPNSIENSQKQSLKHEEISKSSWEKPWEQMTSTKDRHVLTGRSLLRIPNRSESSSGKWHKHAASKISRWKRPNSPHSVCAQRSVLPSSTPSSSIVSREIRSIL